MSNAKHRKIAGNLGGMETDRGIPYVVTDDQFITAQMVVPFLRDSLSCDFLPLSLKSKNSRIWSAAF